MTVFAGVFCISTSSVVPNELKSQITSQLVRQDKGLGVRSVHDVPRLFLAKWDSGAFSEPAWQVKPDGSVATLAGDPLLTEAKRRLMRQDQLDRLSTHIQEKQAFNLASCRGSFALVQYAAERDELCLTTDALGLRPIYYAIQNGLVIFSTALRILESASLVEKHLSILGVAEECAFSFPLADRTPYEEIKVLREAQCFRVTSEQRSFQNYLDWAALQEIPGSMADSAKAIHSEFREAVRLRAGTDRRVYSFLSGGMDSRAIVSELISNGQQVVALNFSAEGSQDQVFAQSFATEAGAACELHCLAGGIFPNFSMLALDAKTKLENMTPTRVDRPRFIWSGDGGSVGLGHVYMDEKMLDIAESRGARAAIEYFLELNKNTLPTGVLAVKARHELPRLIFNSVMAEVDRYTVNDFGRRIYFFLLFNDQRRHLFKHLETIDQHGLELLTPFYDLAFLRAIAATPARWGILHRLYASFFEYLPDIARKTAWQTYPGHVPCPLPKDLTASYQWSKSSWPQRGGIRIRGATAHEMIFSVGDTNQIFSTGRIVLAALAHVLGLRDYSHILSILRVHKKSDRVARSSQK